MATTNSERCRKWYKKNRNKRIVVVTKWIKDNPESVRKYRRKRQKKLFKLNKKLVKNYLLAHPCVDCGNGDTRVLEFDHISYNKKHIISQMYRTYAWKSILKEINKCEVRCANCHKIKTDEERNLKVNNHRVHDKQK